MKKLLILLLLFALSACTTQPVCAPLGPTAVTLSDAAGVQIFSNSCSNNVATRYACDGSQVLALTQHCAEDCLDGYCISSIETNLDRAQAVDASSQTIIQLTAEEEYIEYLQATSQDSNSRSNRDRTIRVQRDEPVLQTVHSQPSELVVIQPTSQTQQSDSIQIVEDVQLVGSTSPPQATQEPSATQVPVVAEVAPIQPVTGTPDSGTTQVVAQVPQPVEQNQAGGSSQVSDVEPVLPDETPYSPQVEPNQPVEVPQTTSQVPVVQPPVQVTVPDQGTSSVADTSPSPKVTESTTLYIVELRGQAILEMNSAQAVDSYVENYREQESTVATMSAQSMPASIRTIATQEDALINQQAQVLRALGFRANTQEDIDQYSMRFAANALSLPLTARQVELARSLSDVIAVHEVPPITPLMQKTNEISGAAVAWTTPCVAGTCYDGTGMKIAIIDSGINYTHPAFGSCTKEQILTKTCPKITVKSYDPATPDGLEDPILRHGTPVAAIAAGDNVMQGVAPKAHLLIYKIYGQGAIVQSLPKVAEDAFLDGADVVSMSIGGSFSWRNPASTVFHDSAFSRIPITLVIAAGNYGDKADAYGGNGFGTSSVTNLGFSKDSITVGSAEQLETWPNLIHASYASYGPAYYTVNDKTNYAFKPEVVSGTPVVCVPRDGEETIFGCNEGFTAFSGTSAATPAVAGMVALIKQAHPTWTKEEIKSALMISSKNSLVKSYPLGSLAYQFYPEPEFFTKQGFGYPYVPTALLMTSPPPVAVLHDAYKEGANLVISATASSSQLIRYELSVGESIEPSQWIQIHSGTTSITKAIMVRVPKSQLPSGLNTLRLQVFDSQGRVATHYTYYDCYDGSCKANAYCDMRTIPTDKQYLHTCINSIRPQALATSSGSVQFTPVSDCREAKPCTYSCAENYELVNGVCVLAQVGCRITQTQFIQAMPNLDFCLGDHASVQSNTPWQIVDSCTEARKCEAVCKEGFVKSGNTCIAQTNTCTGPIPANSQICAGDNTGLTQPTQRVLVQACTPAKCEYTCLAGFININGQCTQPQALVGTFSATYPTGVVILDSTAQNVRLRQFDIASVSDNVLQYAQGKATLQDIAIDTTARTITIQGITYNLQQLTGTTSVAGSYTGFMGYLTTHATVDATVLPTGHMILRSQGAHEDVALLTNSLNQWQGTSVKGHEIRTSLTTKGAFSGTLDMQQLLHFFLSNAQTQYSTDRIINLATRGKVGVAGKELIPGFVVGGDGPTQVLLKLNGPWLGQFGINNFVTDPKFTLYKMGATPEVIFTSDDWITQPDADAIRATPYVPFSEKEAAALLILPPGAYSAVTEGPAGVGLVEVYEIIPQGMKPQSYLVNVATRGAILNEAFGEIIPSFVSSGQPKQVLFRALGKGLETFGVPNPAQDVVLDIVELTPTGNIVRFSNDNYSDSAQTKSLLDTRYVSLRPPHASDSAIIVTLPAGSYTAVVRTKDGSGGNVLVEIYDLDKI